LEWRAGGGIPVDITTSRYRLPVREPDEGNVQRSVKVPIGFPEDLYEWLRDTAHVRRVSMAQVVREAVRTYRNGRPVEEHRP
jgi:hypothetical protein